MLNGFMGYEWVYCKEPTSVEFIRTWGKAIHPKYSETMEGKKMDFLDTTIEIQVGAMFYRSLLLCLLYSSRSCHP